VKREWSALAFAMIFPTIMAWLYFIFLGRPVSPEPVTDPSANVLVQAAYAMGKILQFSFPMIYLAIWEPMSLRPSRPRFQGLRLGIALGLLVAIGGLALYFLGLKNWLTDVGAASMIRHKIQEFNVNTPLRYAGLASFLAVVHSLLEEYYWRWFVFGRLRRFIPLWFAVAVSSLAFMAHHVIILGRFLPNQFWTAAVPLSLCIAIGGAFWAWLYNRSGSLYSTWISHLLVDAAVLTIGYDLVFSK
jgi:uncharacterized protein